MKTDLELQQDIMAELNWEPSINAVEIGVAVKDGVVTLSGYVDSYAQKLAAERAAWRVFGITAVAQGIKVRLPSSIERPDADIAKAAITALEWNTSVPHERIRVKVQNGLITLSGEVDWWYQREAAEAAVCSLMGVTGVSNLIIVTPTVKPVDVKAKIESALERTAVLDARGISVETRGGKVILSGSVHSWSEKNEAQQAACAAPGVTQVENNITISP